MISVLLVQLALVACPMLLVDAAYDSAQPWCMYAPNIPCSNDSCQPRQAVCNSTLLPTHSNLHELFITLPYVLHATPQRNAVLPALGRLSGAFRVPAMWPLPCQMHDMFHVSLMWADAAAFSASFIMYAASLHDVAC